MKARHIKRLRRELKEFEVQQKDYAGYFWNSNPWTTVLARNYDEAANRFYKRHHPGGWKVKVMQAYSEQFADYRVRPKGKEHYRFQRLYC